MTAVCSFIFLCTLFFVSSGVLLADGYEKFSEGDYEAAANAFGAEVAEDSSDQPARFNLGVAKYKLGKFEEAKEHFDLVVKSSSGPLKSKSLFNRGNAEAELGDFESAVGSYRESLSFDNGNQQIAENLEWAEKMAKENPQKKPEKQQDNNSKESKKDKDPFEKQADNNRREEKKEEKSDSKQGNDSDGQQQNQADKGQQKANDAESQSDKNTMEDKAAEQESSEKQGSEKQTAEKGESEVTPKPKGEKEAIAEKEKASSEQQDDGVDKDKEAQAGKSFGNAKQSATDEELRAQDAQKIIRSVDDKIGKYMFRATKEQLEGRPKNGKDW